MAGPANTSGGNDNNPPDVPVRTDKAVVDEWLSRRYLEYELEDGQNAHVTVKEFFDIPALEYPECYFPEALATLPLALSTKKHKRADCVVLSDVAMQTLYNLGTGKDTLAGVSKIGHIQSVILSEAKRWLVVSCSDGVLEADQHTAEWKESKRLAEVEKQKLAKTRAKPEAMDIDSQEGTDGPASHETLAKRIDSKSDKPPPSQESCSKATSAPEKDPPRGPKLHGNHWGFLVVDKTRKVAHWVDSAVTLRNDGNKLKIGHMYNAAVVAGKVLCGIDAILATQEGFEKGKFNASTLKYTPQQARHNISRVRDEGPCGPFMFAFLEHIYANRTKMNNLKASFPRSRRDRLTFDSFAQRQEIQRLIGIEAESHGSIAYHLTPEVLHVLKPITLEQLKNSLDAFRGTLPAASRTAQGKGGGGGGGGGSNDDNKKDDDNDDGDDGSGHEDLRRKYNEAKKNGALPDNVTSLDEYNLYLAQQQSLLDARTRKVVIDEVVYMIPSNDKEVWKPQANGAEWPDFAHIPKPRIDRFMHSDPELGALQESTPHHGHVTSRALLHMKHKKTFLMEPDKNFTDVWKDDPLVFPTEPKNLPASKIRHAMMKRYEPEMLGLIEEYAQRPEKPAYTGPHSKNWILAYPEGFNKNNLPNFADISQEEADPWKALYKNDLFKRPIHIGLDYGTIKAVMHRTYKGSFEGESRDSLRYYLGYDVHAFSDKEKYKSWRDQDIAARLDETYLKLEVPIFADLSDSEIDLWAERLHGDMKAPMKGSDGDFSHNKARGILHRMFVGEFSDMTEEQLRQWRMADPSIPEAYRSDNETALVYMNIMYRVADPATLPWLKESPLHWPILKHRPSRDGKRKRGDDDDDDGGSDNGGNGAGRGKRKKTQGPGKKEKPLKGQASGKTSPKPPEDWATITGANLKQHLTDDVRRDPRVGGTPNSYTYRAILLVRNGGTFKDDSQTTNASLWVRDTNVFTHGPHTDSPRADLVLQEDGTLAISVDPKIILQRMASKYESTGVLSIPVDWDALKIATMNFTRMSTPHVKEWVKLQSDNIPPLAGLPLWHQKAILQKLFGGFDDLPTEDLRYWQNNDRFFRSLKNSKGWNTKNVVPELEKRVADVKAQDLRGSPLYTPDYYLKWFVDNVQEKVVPAKTTQPIKPSETNDLDTVDFSDDEDIIIDDWNSEVGSNQGEDEDENNDQQNQSPKPDPSTEPSKTSDGSSRAQKQGETAAATSTTSAAQPPASTVRLVAPNFLKETKNRLSAWLKSAPAVVKGQLFDANDEIANEIKARIWCQRMFSDLFTTMQAEEPLSDESIKTLRHWRRAWPTGDLYNKNSKAAMKKFLVNVLMRNDVCDQTVEKDGKDVVVNGPLVLPDLRNDRWKWPKYWIKRLEEEEKRAEDAKKAAEDAGQKPENPT